MDKRIELARKDTDEAHLDIGLYFLPDNTFTPYVTWLINISYDPEMTTLGHYFDDLDEASKDFKNRK